MATMVVATGISLVSRAILSRMVGPEGMGIYSLVILVPSLAFVFGCLGMNTSNIYLAGTNRFEIGRLVGTVLVSTLFLSTVLVIILCGWSVLSYHTLFQHAPRAYAAIAILSIPFFFFFNNFMSLLQGRNLISQYNLVSLASVFITLVMLLLLVVVARMGLKGALIAWLTGTVFNAVYAGIKVSRITRIPFRFSPEIFRNQLSYGLKAYFANLAGFLVRRIDVLMVANMLGTLQLGYYSIAFTIAELLWYMASSATTALIPYVAGADRGDSRSVTAAVVRVTLWGTAALCLMVPILDRLAIKVVLGPAFLPAVVPLRWLLPGILLGAIEKILAGDLAGRGRPDITMFSAFLALAVDVVVNLFLIPRMGIAGAALASSLAYAAAAIFTLTRFMRITGTSCSQALILRKSDLIYLGALFHAALGRAGLVAKG